LLNDLVVISLVIGITFAVADAAATLALFPPVFGVGPRAWTRVRPPAPTFSPGMEHVRTKSATARRSGPSRYVFRQTGSFAEPWTPFRIKGLVRLENGRTLFEARLPLGTYLGLAVVTAGYGWNLLGSMLARDLPGVRPEADPIKFAVVVGIMGTYLVWSWRRQRAWFLAMVDELYAAIRKAHVAR